MSGDKQAEASILMTHATQAEAFAEKLQRIRTWLEDHQLAAILLTSQSSFSWLTAGRGHIGLHSEQACGKFLVTQDNVHLIVNNIEAERLRHDELGELPIQLAVFPWYAVDGEQAVLSDLVKGAAWMEEAHAGRDFTRLRWELTAYDAGLYREASQSVAKALEAVCFDLRPGQTEFEIAARLAAHCVRDGVDPVLQLVAVDERTQLYRHPLPTHKPLQRYAMVVVGGRKYGLTVSATRLVHFGNLPAELRQKQTAVAQLDAEIIAMTRPGQVVGEIFSHIQNRYAKLGYAGEWTLHHQGGLTGYASREYRATQLMTERVAANQAFAWNPSIQGTKSEDTVLVGSTGYEIMTETGEWPQLEIEVAGHPSPVKRPDILIL